MIAGAGFGAQVHLPAVAAGGLPVAIADSGSGRAEAAAAEFRVRAFNS